MGHSESKYQADLRPKADKHRDQQHRVFDLPVDSEMVVHGKQNADYETDRQRYRIPVRMPYPQPQRANYQIHHQLQYVDTIQLVRPLSRFLFCFCHYAYCKHTWCGLAIKDLCQLQF